MERPSILFGSEFRFRRPVLLSLVFGAVLVIVGITAAGLSTIVSTHVTSVAVQTIVNGDAIAIVNLANDDLAASDLVPGSTVDPVRQAVFARALERIITPGGLLRIEVQRADGVLIAAGRPGPIAAEAPDLGDQPQAAVVALDQASASVADLARPWLVQERLPITDPTGRVVAVATMWRDAAPIRAQADGLRDQVILVTLSAAALASALLLLIFRSAQRRLTRQTLELVEATRTDPLTGTLNHGALVATLAGLLETARANGPASAGSIGVALIDVDNFTMLNDNHGHKVGDAALAAVLEVLRDVVPAAAIIGRYGPDEFLVIAPETARPGLESVARALRRGLSARALVVDAPDRLPITISAGIASYPRDATSLTVLLATVASTLGAAKASGGDEVRVAGSEDAEPSATSSFDVLQGLVFAVDTKDRYTKRHSEDVARYAVFLAGRVGLDEATMATIARAGLLHDVGKIGIPDAILRKPGKLTDAEMAIVRQHVVLGDMIVRDVPDIDLVRAGIRHHHERWDGNGYVDRLTGEEIPLIARILAVGDTFSAMTTTRPYRKALAVPEAMRRLEDAAGTQLDATLVATFIDGLETASDAPLPGDDTGFRLFAPRAVA